MAIEQIDIKFFCPKCKSENIDIGKNKGFADTLLIFVEGNECMDCGCDFDCDVGIISVSYNDKNYTTKRLHYSIPKTNDIQQIDI